MPVIYLAIFSTGIAFFIQINAQKKLKASKVAIILSVEAIFASVISVISGYDTLDTNLFAGGLLVTFSIIIMEMDIRVTKKENKSIDNSEIEDEIY